MRLPACLAITVAATPSSSPGAEMETTFLNEILREKSSVHDAWDIGAEIRARQEIKDDAFDLHQAYLKLGDAKRFPITAQIGRQEMVYGYGHFFTGDYIDDSVGGSALDADWFYTQLTLTF